MNRREMMTLCAGAGAAAVLGTGPSAWAQSPLPDRPIRILVPFAAGGSTDGAARLFAELVGRQLQRTVVIENRPGAAGALAITGVAQSAPDGTALLFGTATTHIFLPMTTTLRESPIDDLPPLAILAQESCAIAVNSQLPVTTLGELIAYAKKRPGQINYGSSGTGGLSHYASEMLNMQAGIDMTHVPYRGGGQMAPDWAANRVHVSCGSLSSSIPFYREGKVRILAVCADKRAESLPDIPTVAEAGLPGLIIGTFHSVCAAAATPAPVIETLAQASRAVTADDAFRSRLIGQGVEPVPALSPAEAVRYVRQLAERIAPVVKAVSGVGR